MDRHTLEHQFLQARARVVQGQQALLQQRQHIRDLERAGLDGAAAREMLWIYEQSQAMNLFERERLRQRVACARLAPAPPSAPPHDMLDVRLLERRAA